MSKVDLRRLSKRIHKGLSKDMTLMQVQHLVAQAHGHESWDSMLANEKQSSISININPVEGQHLDHEWVLEVDNIRIGPIHAIELNNTTRVQYLDVGPPFVVPVHLRQLVKERVPFASCYRPSADIIQEKFDTVDALILRIKDFQNGKYIILPSHNPAEGCIGFWIMMNDDGIRDLPPEHALSFYPYGKLDICRTDHKDATEFMQMYNQDYYNCDDPKARCLGLVKYDIQNKKSYAHFLSITKLKEATIPADMQPLKYRRNRGKSPFIDILTKIYNATGMQKRLEDL